MYIHVLIIIHAYILVDLCADLLILCIHGYIYRHTHTSAGAVRGRAWVAGGRGPQAGADRKRARVVGERCGWRGSTTGTGRGQARVVGQGHKPHHTISARGNPHWRVPRVHCGPGKRRRNPNCNSMWSCSLGCAPILRNGKVPGTRLASETAKYPERALPPKRRCTQKLF